MDHDPFCSYVAIAAQNLTNGTRPFSPVSAWQNTAQELSFVSSSMSQPKAGDFDKSITWCSPVSAASPSSYGRNFVSGLFRVQWRWSRQLNMGLKDMNWSINENPKPANKKFGIWKFKPSVTFFFFSKSYLYCANITYIKFWRIISMY